MKIIEKDKIAQEVKDDIMEMVHHYSEKHDYAPVKYAIISRLHNRKAKSCRPGLIDLLREMESEGLIVVVNHERLGGRFLFLREDHDMQANEREVQRYIEAYLRRPK